MSPWLRGWRARAVLAAPGAALLLALLAGELTVRLLLPPLSPLEFLVTDPFQRAHLTDDREVGIFEADPLLFWRLKPNLREVVWDFTLVSTNPDGLRQPRQRETPGASRVLALGDSVTFGYRVPLVWPERPAGYLPNQPYPLLLEEPLGEALGKPVEVSLLAVPGFTSHQGRAWLEREIGRRKPHLVTVCFGWNDVSPRALSDAAAMPTSWPRVAARAVVMRSQLLMRVSGRVRSWHTRRARPFEQWPPRVSLRDYIENHLAIARLAKLHGARTLVIGPVFRDAEESPDVALSLGRYRSALAAAMQDARIAYLEVESLTESGHPANRSLFGEAIHPNARGHRVLAGALLETIVRERLLTRKD